MSITELRHLSEGISILKCMFQADELFRIVKSKYNIQLKLSRRDFSLYSDQVSLIYSCTIIAEFEVIYPFII